MPPRTNTEKGTISNLFRKPATGCPMALPQEGHILLKERFGIEGDCNSDTNSPRQVLIVRKEDLNRFGITPGGLRENIVIEGISEKSFTPGSLLHLGPLARIRLTFYCEPCKRIGHLVQSLFEIESKRGILGVVLNGGIIQPGDLVKVENDIFPPLSPVPYERFLAFVSGIPYGRVAGYKEVITGIGVATSYMRALPRYISKAAEMGYPVHRIVDSSGGLNESRVFNQRDLLAGEGIEVLCETDLFDMKPRHYVDLQQYVSSFNLAT